MDDEREGASVICHKLVTAATRVGAGKGWIRVSNGGAQARQTPDAVGGAR